MIFGSEATAATGAAVDVGSAAAGSGTGSTGAADPLRRLNGTVSLTRRPFAEATVEYLYFRSSSFVYEAAHSRDLFPGRTRGQTGGSEQVS